MGDILCALRGGPGSHFTRRAALDRGYREGSRVHFLSLVAPGLYGPLHSGEQDAIRFEMDWRNLALARSTAAQIGVVGVEFVNAVIVGELLESIVSYVTGHQIGAVMVGTPREVVDARFTQEGVAQLAASIKRASQVDVQVVARS